MGRHLHSEAGLICVLCRHAALELNRETLALQNVPAEICPECSEAFLDEAVVRRALAQAAEMAGGVE